MTRASYRTASLSFSRSQITCFAAAALAFCLAAAPNRARAEDRIEVKLDQAQVLQLPANASIVVLGNPVVADVTLIKKSNSMILTGKSFGETNLIALDKDGHTVGESLVRVSAPASSLVLQLGTARQTYSCDPRCQPSFSLGDDTQYATSVSGQIQARNSLAQPPH